MKYLFIFAIMAFASSAYAEPFPKLIQKVFVKVCVGDDPKSEPYCLCTMDEMQKTMTYQEFEAVTSLSEEKMMEDEKFSDAVVACIDKLPE